VLPLTRSPITPEQPPAPAARSDVDRYLRVAAARGASALYLVAKSKPVLRVDGEISILDQEDALTATQVEALMMDVAPEPTREVLRSGVATEWVCDVAEVGRVRCLSFRDHRGPGAMFRMLPARAISAEQLGLSTELQNLCALSDGLVVVSGPRASGKSTLISAFVDLINRTRGDHVITIERQITFVHESRRSFVSQREVRGDADDMAAATRAALREDPDVLIVEELQSPEMIGLALDASASGRLVFGAIPAASAAGAVERLVDQFPVDRRGQAQTALSAALRAVVVQVLLRKVRGGRVAARELLLNTPAVASLIAEGRTFQIPVALDSGRRHGMTPLNDALAAYVRTGQVNPAEAYRKSTDREGLVALLKHDGIDTSFTERLA
jgi:twitching motility protein PilT